MISLRSNEQFPVNSVTLGGSIRHVYRLRCMDFPINVNVCRQIILQLPDAIDNRLLKVFFFKVKILDLVPV